MDEGHYKTMLEAMEAVPDPRKRRGVRYPWGLLMGLIGAAMAGGNRHGRAIGQWVGGHPDTPGGLLELGEQGLPSESTLRRALEKVNVGELEARLAEHSAGLGVEVQGLRGQAMDGKQVRGCGAHGRPMHLLSVASHEGGAALAQVQVGVKENEIVAAPGLLAGLELSGMVTTMDAMLAQRAIAEQILEQGGHYLMVAKDN
jgi:hypothetical protein